MTNVICLSKAVRREESYIAKVCVCVCVLYSSFGALWSFKINLHFLYSLSPHCTYSHGDLVNSEGIKTHRKNSFSFRLKDCYEDSLIVAAGTMLPLNIMNICSHMVKFQEYKALSTGQGKRIMLSLREKIL